MPAGPLSGPEILVGPENGTENGTENGIGNGTGNGQAPTHAFYRKTIKMDFFLTLNDNGLGKRERKMGGPEKRDRKWAGHDTCIPQKNY